MKLILGDCLEKLKELSDNSIDSVVTDPPYGLGKEPNALAMLKDWIEIGYHNVKSSRGFMGKEWDAFVPQPILWKEVYRVLKPGGHVLCFAGTRTMDLICLSLRIAGFEIRDSIGYAHEYNTAPLMAWCYGNGFPKSLNIGKVVDKLQENERKVVGEKIIRECNAETKTGSFSKNKFEGQTEIKRSELLTKDISEWKGWGTALKPAWEPIILCRKPLNEKTIVENVLKYRTGGINIDGCKVKMNEEDNKMLGAIDSVVKLNNCGRFPANLILSHSKDCKYIETKVIKSKQLITGNYKKDDDAKFVTDTIKTVEQWECVEDCPVKIMDEQSRDRKDWTSQNHNMKFNMYDRNTLQQSTTTKQRFHGASRFFYCAKVDKKERNKGLDEFEEKQININKPHNSKTLKERYAMTSKNNHPTVKPLKLMKYLVRLITPQGGVVLDPFMGSGSTGIACKQEGFDFIGIEKEKDYMKIAEARINNYDS